LSAYVIAGITSTCVKEMRIDMRRRLKRLIRRTIRFRNAQDYQVAGDALDPRRIDEGHISLTSLETHIRVSIAKVPVG